MGWDSGGYPRPKTRCSNHRHRCERVIDPKTARRQRIGLVCDRCYALRIRKLGRRA